MTLCDRLPPSSWRRLLGVGLLVVGLHACLLWQLNFMTAPPSAPVDTFVVRLALPPLAPQAPVVQHASPAIRTPARPLPVAKSAAPPAPRERVAQSTQAPAMAASAVTPTAGPTPPPPGAFALSATHQAMNPVDTAVANVATAPALQLPSSNADYLHNPPPSYPAISRRLGEQGQVLIRVLVGKDGSARQADIHQSSGFARLDQSALQAVLRWRFVPGKRSGQAEDMWFQVPVDFSLQ